MRRSVSFICLAIIVAPGALAAKRPFSIHDDVLAFPQYDVIFPEEYVLETEADAILQLQKARLSEQFSAPPQDAGADQRDLARHSLQKPLVGVKNSKDEGKNNQGSTGGENDDSLDWDPETSLKYFSYEEMKLDGLRYLCNIPRVGIHEVEDNSTTTAGAGSDGAANNDATQEENEVARATNRGLELLQEMEGNCMYYVSGWWSYSFCYKKQVKQFHARSGPGVPNYPPIEDKKSLSFVLGKFESDEDAEGRSSDSSNDGQAPDSPPAPPKTKSTAELQTKGESRYLVQRLGGGTTCDLTGSERKIEVQFHCHPQSTDRIGWIKEITTCSYLMVIYTPRLCHDVAFQLPQPEDTHAIQCREILAPDEIEEFEAMKAHHDSQKLVNSGFTEAQVVGGIEVGAKKQVGSEGTVIQKGRIAKIGEESIEVVAKREGGKVSQLSEDELRKWNLDPEEVDSLRKELESFFDGKDWKLALVVESNGDRSFRAIFDSNENEEKSGDATSDNEEKTSREDTPEEEMGSEETFKDEL